MKDFRHILLMLAAVCGLASCHGYIDPETDGGKDETDGVDTTIVLSSGYARHMIAMQFTSTGCMNCPLLASALKDVVMDYPNVIPVSFHMDYGGLADPMTLPVNAKFYEKVNTGDGMGLPLFALDFRKSSQHIINEYAKMKSEVESWSKASPAICGVAVETSYDVADRALEVTAKFKADVPGRYRYHIFLVEDGLEYSQAGAEGQSYIHDNVFRMMLGDNVVGEKLNGGKYLEAGKEYEVTKKVTLPQEWNPANMRVLAMMLDTRDGGETFSCNNACRCALGESADYAYEGDEKVEPRFQRHVCVMEFTGAWCSQCPAGATTLNYLIDRQYKGKAFALAFHNASGGEPIDPFVIPQEQELYNIFALGGYPAYVTDMRDVGLLNEGGCEATIKKSLTKSLTHCGVALECSYDAEAGKARAEARLFSELSSAYRLAAYVVEDKVVGEQKESTGSVRPDYTHRHVVRAMISSNVRGDGLGEVAAGTEAEKTYDFNVDPQWNLENLHVAVLAIDSDGHVNNMAQCAVNGGRMDYEYR